MQPYSSHTQRDILNKPIVGISVHVNGPPPDETHGGVEIGFFSKGYAVAINFYLPDRRDFLVAISIYQTNMTFLSLFLLTRPT
jgi:hypothetical protein